MATIRIFGGRAAGVVAKTEGAMALNHGNDNATPVPFKKVRRGSGFVISVSIFCIGISPDAVGTRTF
jgi:hypothetical protein